MLESYKFTAGFFLWLALVTFLSLYSFSDFGEVGFEIPFLDKLVHFIFYFVGTLLGCMFIRERTSGSAPRHKSCLLTGLFMLLFGALMEWLQLKITEVRSGEILDLAANLAGVVFALLTVNYLFSPKTGLKWKY